VSTKEADAKTMRGLSIMSAGLFGLFLCLLALSQIVTA
jgi:hypothetical protein